MDTIGSLLNELLTALASLSSGDVGKAFLALAAAGTISMAALQVLKELTCFRTWYQRRWFDGWLTERAVALQTVASAKTISKLIKASPCSVVAASTEIVELSAGGMGRALFAMQIEAMVAQMKQSIPIILDEPGRYPSTLLVLSLYAAEDDLAVLLDGQPQGSAQQYFDARARVTRRMERNLDGVRIALSDRWKFWMQFLSLTLTTLVVEAAVAMTGRSSWSLYVLAVPFGIVGGYFAPVTRDLLAALQKLRQP